MNSELVYVELENVDGSEVNLPLQLMNAGHHFDDMPRALRRTTDSYDGAKTHGAKTQRELLRNIVINSHMTRPTKRLVRPTKKVVC
jgi:hypothetical protein